MQKLDNDTMIHYGQWLEKILSQDNWGLKRQFHKGSELLNLDTPPPLNDLSLILINKIENEGERDYYTRRAFSLTERGDISVIEHFRGGHDPLKIYAFLYDLKENHYKNYYDEDHFDSVLNSVLLMYYDRSLVLRWFKGLKDNDIPWMFNPDTPWVFNPDAPYGIDHLVQHYNGIRESLTFDKTNDFQHNITFSREYYYAKLGTPVEVVLSHIALDFLMAREDNSHFGFCNQCGEKL